MPQFLELGLPVFAHRWRNTFDMSYTFGESFWGKGRIKKQFCEIRINVILNNDIINLIVNLRINFIKET